MSEIPGQSGHALPSLQQPVCANTDREFTLAATIPTNLGHHREVAPLFAENFDGRALAPWFDKPR